MVATVTLRALIMLVIPLKTERTGSPAAAAGETEHPEKP